MEKITAKISICKVLLLRRHDGGVQILTSNSGTPIKKHFKEHPYLSEEAIFFHDADFVFTRYMDFSKFLNDDKWYFSDTISYIGYDYIMSKGEEVLDAMCDIIGIDKSVVKDNQLNSGGAQKLFKNIDYKYWEMVEEYSNKLHDRLSNMQHVKKNEDHMGYSLGRQACGQSYGLDGS